MNARHILSGCIRVVALMIGVGAATTISTSSTWGQEAPWTFVSWRPITGNPVFTGTGADTWDHEIRERGWILVGQDGVFHLWYTGYAQDKPTTMSLGHASSPDGIHWTRNPHNPIFHESWVEDMCVILQDGTYQMFAEGRNDIAHRLSSRDGLHWTDHGSLQIRRTDGSPISPGPYGTPTAWFERGIWYLFYERGDQGIWLATSRDLRTWTNVKDDPVIARGPDAYDEAAVALNQVIKRGDYYYAFYHANAHRPWKDWTSNVARSRDLVHWQKYPGNPIIKDNCSSPVLVATPTGERLYTMHPDVKAFEPASGSR